ncbi:LOW QUALITY PROTEIN: transcription factor EC [Varanus komodoensis]|uniref:LOW QUALITY PROTEIN: transcription factor EC n=1 Tax=Varanus komodoensis TaxID=61221 RepID=UPI001CF7DB63|nr:LOW QUALITY PROTEIN: transcription factor EC [Varanus komodoensis]
MAVVEEESNRLSALATPLTCSGQLCFSTGLSPASEAPQRKLHQELEGLPCVKIVTDDIFIIGEGLPQSPLARVAAATGVIPAIKEVYQSLTVTPRIQHCLRLVSNHLATFPGLFDCAEPKMPHLTDCSYSQVQTHLENPTRYHIQQTQRHQVKQFLTLDTKLSSQTLSLSHSHSIHSSAAAPILRSGHMPPTSDISTSGSPVTKLLTLGGEHENAMEEVIDDIINMESRFNDEGIGCSETPLLMQRTVIERRRRYNINYRIKELGTLIPKSNDPDMRWNKGTILKASVEYIKWLQKEQQRARELEHRQKKLEQANRRLLLRIQELEIQARAHGLPLMSSVGTVDLASHVMKQPAYPEENSIDYSRHLAVVQEQHSDLGDTTAAFSDPLSHFTDLSFSAALKEQRLDEILLDDTISPFGTDPLLSSASPAVSKGSSQRSSFSSDDGDDV